MSNYDILTLQSETAKRHIEFAIKNRIPKIVLSMELVKVLKAELILLDGMITLLFKKAIIKNTVKVQRKFLSNKIAIIHDFIKSARLDQRAFFIINYFLLLIVGKRSQKYNYLPIKVVISFLESYFLV
jgi:hypothetical protein